MKFLRYLPYGLFAGVGALAIVACSSSDDNALEASLAEGCSINSECTDPLVCAFKTCHNACKTTRDCPAGQRCVASDRPYNVCQLPSEAVCSNNNQCALGEICASDDQCRDECQTARDCVTGQVCTAGACAETSELEDGHLPSSSDAGASEGIACVYNTDCPVPLTCKNGRCASECHGDRDCANGERCVNMSCVGSSASGSDGGGGGGGGGEGGPGNLPPSCADHTKDGSETDVDCGGSCAPCAASAACGVPADCASNMCTNHMCIAQPAGGQVSNLLYDSDQPTFTDAATLDAAGNLVFSLTTNGTINFGAGPVTPNGNELFVAKASANGGAATWARELAGGHDAVGTFEDANGDVLVVGTTNGGSVGGAALGCGNSVFVAKYAGATGAHIWSKCYTAATGVYGSVSVGAGIVPKGAALDKDGNVEIGGTITVVNPANGGQGFATFPYVAKIAGADGTPTWSRYYNDANSTSQVNSVAVDSTSNIIITGSYGFGSVGFGGTAMINAGANDIFVVKLNPNGDYVWSHGIGGSLDDSGVGVGVDASNDVILAANFQSQIDGGKGPITSAGSYDVLIAKLSGTDGTTQWVNRYGGATEESARALAMGPGNTIAVAGEFTGNVTFGGTALTDVGGRDLFVAKLEGAGTLDWVHGYGSTGDDAIGRVSIGANGNIALTGYVAGSVNFGAGAITACSKAMGGACQDGFLVVLGP